MVLSTLKFPEIHGFEICPKEPCFLVKDEILLFILESEEEKFDPRLDRQLIGSLMQLATWTRPYSVSIFPILFKSSSKTLDIGSRVVNYLKTAQDSVLFLSSEQGGR